MSYNLHTPQKSIRLNMTAYRQMLTLAKDYKWEPMGTINGHPELSDNWSGTYFSNNQQTILQEDAINLGKSLELALLELPTEPLVELTIDNQHLEPLVFFTGRQGLIEEFIALCNTGNITIS